MESLLLEDQWAFHILSLIINQFSVMTEKYFSFKKASSQIYRCTAFYPTFLETGIKLCEGLRTNLFLQLAFDEMPFGNIHDETHK